MFGEEGLVAEMMMEINYVITGHMIDLALKPVFLVYSLLLAQITGVTPKNPKLF